MKRLWHTISRIAKSNAARPRFDDALITSNAGRYGFYRLRFLSLRMVLRAALALIEISLFSLIFDPEYLAPVIIVRSLMALISGLWWGGLEEMREEVRAFVSRKEWGSVRRVIDSWMSFGLFSCTVLTGIGILAIAHHSSADNGFNVYSAYLVACIIRLCFDMISRTYHSGIYAFRRVYRPLWSLLLCDILDVVLVLLLWTTLFVWAFAATLVLVGILRFGLLVYFTRKTYRDSPVPAMNVFPILRAFVRIPTASLGRFAIHAAANISSQIDTILIVTLTATSATRDDGFVLALALYLLRPFLSAGYSWSRLFYFDFKVIKDRYGDFVRTRFERFMKKTAVVFSVITALICLGWMRWVVPFMMEIPPDDPFFVALQQIARLLFPFILLRAWFGLFHLQAFSYGRYKYLLKLTVITGAGIFASVMLTSNTAVLLLSLCAVILLAIVVFPSPGPQPKTPATHRMLSLPAFLSAVKKMQEPVHLGVFRFNTTQLPLRRICTNLLENLPTLELARFDRSGVVWLCKNKFTHSKIVTLSGGTITQLQVIAENEEGSSAVAKLILSRAIRDLTPAYSQTTEAVLVQKFTSQFPDATFFNTQRGAFIATKKNARASRAVKQVLRTLSKTGYSSTTRHFDSENLDMTVYCPAGEPAIVFMIPSTVPIEKRLAWADEVHIASLMASI